MLRPPRAQAAGGLHVGHLEVQLVAQVGKHRAREKLRRRRGAGRRGRRRVGEVLAPAHRRLERVDDGREQRVSRRGGKRDGGEGGVRRERERDAALRLRRPALDGRVGFAVDVGVRAAFVEHRRIPAHAHRAAQVCFALNCLLDGRLGFAVDVRVRAALGEHRCIPAHSTSTIVITGSVYRE